MKRILAIASILLTLNLPAQEGFQMGLELSPAWNVNIQRQEGIALRTYTSGYGFNIGVPVKWWAYESLALQTGLTFEFMAFDNRIGNSLSSSNRHGSIHLPVMFNYALSSNWYVLFGGGVNYNVLNYQWTPIGNLGLTAVTNNFQPYGGLGLSTLMERDKGVFELGAQGRFHFIDLYKSSTFSAAGIINRILTFDLVLRYYLFNR